MTEALLAAAGLTLLLVGGVGLVAHTKRSAPARAQLARRCDWCRHQTNERRRVLEHHPADPLYPDSIWLLCPSCTARRQVAATVTSEASGSSTVAADGRLSEACDERTI